MVAKVRNATAYTNKKPTLTIKDAEMLARFAIPDDFPDAHVSVGIADGSDAFFVKIHADRASIKGGVYCVFQLPVAEWKVQVAGLFGRAKMAFAELRAERLRAFGR